MGWSEAGTFVFRVFLVQGCPVLNLLGKPWSAVPASVVCATLPGELHDLGVHLSAVAVASGGRRPLVLPGETPVADIVAAAAATASVVVAISLSVHAGNRDYLPMLNELRRRLPDDTQLWVGGSGAPQEVPGAVVSDDLARLADLV